MINATGAWADKLRNEVVTEQRVRPLRGSHVVVAKATLPVNSALTLLHSADKRPVFIYPWEGATIIGTTDLDHQDDLDNEAKISQEELDYLLAVVNENFAQYQLTHQDIISTFSGVRPVISCDRHFAKQASKERRDHAIWAESGLVTASGGKLTTFRLTAIEALDAAMPWFASETKNQQEHQQSDQSHVFSNLAVELLFPSKHQHNIAWLARLVGRYGNNAPLILSNTNQAEAKLIENTQFCLAECRWAIKHEAVVHLDDLLLRYTEKHPDVIEVNRRLVHLNNQRSKEIEEYLNARQDGDSNKMPTSQNPVIQQLQIQVNQLENQVASTNVRVNDYRQQVKDLESKIHILPEIEAELTSLNRGYEITKTKYEELLIRKETAQLAQQADESTNSIQFGCLTAFITLISLITEDLPFDLAS